MSVKEAALNAVPEMPEEVSFEELLGELKILSDLRRADAEIDAGDFVSHDEVKQEIATWFCK